MKPEKFFLALAALLAMNLVLVALVPSCEEKPKPKSVVRIGNAITLENSPLGDNCVITQISDGGVTETSIVCR